MKGKITWLLVSFLMVVSLVLASCAPAVPVEEKREVPVIKEEKKEAVKEEKKEVVTSGQPQYGGRWNINWTADPLGWDP